MQNNPLVSIITPCYNAEKWLERYLKSILNQTYPTIELIIINDGSHDNTARIVLDYKDKLEANGIRLVYRWQENRGLGGAINAGLKLVSGKYFTWCDSDNFYTDDYVETKVRFFEAHPEFDVVRCDGYIVKYSAISKPIQLMSKGNTDRFKQKLFLNALETKNFHFGCAMLKTASFDNINPDREIYPSREGQNWQLLLPMFYHYQSGYIDRPMFYFVVRQDSISNVTAQKGFQEKADQLDEYLKIISETLSAMHLTEDEYKKYLTIIRKKYAAEKLSLGSIYRDKVFLENQYKLMKENNWVTTKDTLEYFSGRYILWHLLYKLYKVFRYPISTFKRDNI